MTRQRAYIVSPHDNVRNFYKNAKGMSVHRVSKNKDPLSPVFKSDRQRVDFKKATIKARKSLEQKIKSTPWTGPGADPRKAKLRVLKDLNRQSQPRHARRNFRGITDPSPKVYLQGHGLPGDQHITDDAGNQATAAQSASMLKGMEVPQQSRIRCNSCFSATPSNIDPAQAATAIASPQGLSGHVAALPGVTFAGTVTHQMRNVAPTFPQIQVAGYPGATTTEQVAGVMGTVFGNFDATGAFIQGSAYKRGDTKVHF